MGTYFRFFEDRIEKQLCAHKAKGVLGPPVEMRVGSNGRDFQGLDPARDRRALVPRLGLREYWYPALPAKKVGRKPVYWLMLGEELAFFRDKEGNVVALSDVCPHRGASLSEGDCFYRGFVTCPYHGATYNGRGECVAFITEGPESKMVGKLNVRSYPTRTLRDWVFVWMGQGEPAPIEEDVAPELFEPEGKTMVFSTYTYWHSNWMIAVENHKDPHNTFFVHRNSVTQLRSAGGFRPTPLGPRSKIVNGRSLVGDEEGNSRYYSRDGKSSYHLYFPGVDGVWPLHQWRRLWGWFFRLFRGRRTRYEAPAEWENCNHLPSIVRSGVGGHGVYTRQAVPVTANLSRIVYFDCMRPQNWWGRLWERIAWVTYYNWLVNYNFSGQDNGASAPVRYWTPEYLSSTDSFLIAWRKLVTEGSRDALRRKAAGESQPTATETPAEEASYQRQSELGLEPEKIKVGRT